MTAMVHAPRTRPGPFGFRVSAVAGALDWSTLDAMWARAGELGAFDAAWLSDHLSDASRERGGVAFESVTTAAALAHRVPGAWVGIAVVANTFRHPAVLAKAATIVDNATGGRFILGLGAGWHEGEHEAFGIPLPPLRERFDRYESTLRVLRALFSEEARQAPGVDLDDPFVQLRGATNEPPPARAGGPLIWLGGQRRRGIELAARYADGWPMPGDRAGDVPYFAQKRDEIRRALEATDRDPDDFSFAGQVLADGDRAVRRQALATAEAFVRAGADHVIVGIQAASGPSMLAAVARDVAAPLRERFG